MIISHTVTDKANNAIANNYDVAYSHTAISFGIFTFDLVAFSRSRFKSFAV